MVMSIKIWGKLCVLTVSNIINNKKAGSVLLSLLVAYQAKQIFAQRARPVVTEPK